MSSLFLCSIETLHNHCMGHGNGGDDNEKCKAVGEWDKLEIDQCKYEEYAEDR